jgi:predicted ester cyclase
MAEYFERAYNLGDAAAIDEFIAPEVRAEGLTPEPLEGREAFRQWYTAFRTSFSEIKCKVSHIWVDGKWVIVRVEFTGVHTGPGMGPAPTNNVVRLPAIVAARLENGQIVDGYNELNHFSLMQQMGAI